VRGSSRKQIFINQITADALLSLTTRGPEACRRERWRRGTNHRRQLPQESATTRTAWTPTLITNIYK